jgi:diguanylate cyclase (GGDEF)-like protein/PAS domain S-box-containing protein
MLILYYGGALLVLTTIVTWAMYGWYRRQIRAQRLRFHAVARSSADAICLSDLHGVVEYWSPGAVAMFGYTAHEMQGQPIQRLAPLDRQAEEVQLHSHNSESICTLETQRLHQNGSLIPVVIAVTTIVDADGRRVGFSRVLRDTSMQKLATDLVRTMSINDALTGLPNLSLLRDRLWRAQLHSNRQRSYFAVLYVDLDNFKQVNEKHGHAIGDKLLVEVTVRIMAAIRQNDTVGRLGGNEFVVLLEDLGAEEAYAVNHVNAVADKILDLLDRDYVLGDLRLRCISSIGIHLLLGGNGSVDQLIKAAQTAMQVSRQGRQAVALGVFRGKV